MLLSIVESNLFQSLPVNFFYKILKQLIITMMRIATSNEDGLLYSKVFQSLPEKKYYFHQFHHHKVNLTLYSCIAEFNSRGCQFDRWAARSIFCLLGAVSGCFRSAHRRIQRRHTLKQRNARRRVKYWLPSVRRVTAVHVAVKITTTAV